MADLGLSVVGLLLANCIIILCYTNLPLLNLSFLVCRLIIIKDSTSRFVVSLKCNINILFSGIQNLKVT